MTKVHSRMLSGSPLLMGDSNVPGVPIHREFREVIERVFKECRDFGLDFYPTIIQFLTYDEISEIASYGGFPRRYPHWSFGAEYEELSRGYEYGMHRISEMVINVNPCIIYFLDSNTLVDNIDVLCHALGHNDFFKNNVFFKGTNTDMMSKMANHGTRIRRYMRTWGKEKVTAFIDHIRRIDTLIDASKEWRPTSPGKQVFHDERIMEQPERRKSHNQYMNEWVNDPEYQRKEKERIIRKETAKELELFDGPEKDIMRYLRDHAPLKPWQQDIIAMLYDEAIYFAPQRLTKRINEGHACLKKGEVIYTNRGLLKIEDIVGQKQKLQVFDGDCKQNVVNWFTFSNREIRTITTRRGLVLGGSSNHRILDENNDWKQLDQLSVGDKVLISSRVNIWNNKHQTISYKQIKDRITLREICKKYHVDPTTFRKVRDGKKIVSYRQNIVQQAVGEYEQSIKNCGGYCSQHGRRKIIWIPKFVDERLASFLGYMIGDGHISESTRTLGLTSGDDYSANDYIQLVKNLFNLETTKKWDSSSKNGRWRVSVHSLQLQDFLVSLGMKTGVCAREKTIPDCVLQSPKKVVSAFLRSYFDCDGYAGPAGVILSTSSTELGKQVQILLMNYGILSRRKLGKDGCWHVNVTGKSAVIFRDEIGFGLTRKQQRLNDYINDRKGFAKDDYTDEIVSIETSVGDVYDISVENTHCYAAQGFINHNSWVDHHMMTKQGLCALGQKRHDMGIFTYAKHKMQVLGGQWSTNPYKFGFELLMDIEDRWNKGRFGREWEDCDDMETKKNWDKKLGLGKEKVFQVRQYCNDLTLVSEYFTPEFCEKQQYYEKKAFPNGEHRIASRDFASIKKKIMQDCVNGGLPDIRLVDPNHRGKGWFLMQHLHDGRPLYDSYARDTLTSIWRIWKNTSILATKDEEGAEFVYICTGKDPKKDVVAMHRKDYESQ